MTRRRRQFGQHFLEPAWAAKVIAAIDPGPEETFLEIGAGRGAITRPLAERARSVVAYEIDRDLAAQLRRAAPPNLTIVEGDFLEASVDAMRETFEDARVLRIAGNLPYYVAAPIMFRLVGLHGAGFRAADATVMVQHEVADRLVAAPGTRDYGVLTVLIGRRAAIERVLALPPGAFRPPPKVRSALVRLRFHPPAPLCRDEALLTRLVQAVFTRRRKMLRNALAAVLPTATPASGPGLVRLLERAGIDGRRRPETLSAGELVRLADAFVDVSQTG